MIIVGTISSKEFGEEIMRIAKIYMVGQRAQFLSRQARGKDKWRSNKAPSL